jgi:hypothetical protein
MSKPTKFQWLFLPGILQADTSSNVAESADDLTSVGCMNGDQTSPDMASLHYYSIKYMVQYSL